MAVAQSVKLQMKFIVECLFKHKNALWSIPSIRIQTVCDGRLYPRQLCQSAQFSILGTRGLCSDTTQAVTAAKRGPPDEETKQYLTSFGIDCDHLQKFRPTVLRQNVSTVKHHVLFLQSLNLSDEEIVAILKKSPELLKVNMFGIQGHVRFLQEDLGLDGLLILNILQRVPKFFASPLSMIKENVEYAQTLNLTLQNMHILMKFTPSLFYRSRNGIQSTGEHLRKILLKHDPMLNPDKCLRYMLRCDPLTFSRSIKEIDDRVQNLIDLGFTGVTLTKIIRFCPSVLRIGTSFITDRIQSLQDKLSISYKDVLVLVDRMPKLLHFSDETIDTKINLILEKGYKTSDLVRVPRTFARSLQSMENRLDRIAEVKTYRFRSLNFLQKTDKEFEEYLEDMKQKDRLKKEKLDSSTL